MNLLVKILFWSNKQSSLCIFVSLGRRGHSGIFEVSEMDAEVGKHPTLIGIPVKQTLICRPKTMYGTWIVHCKLDLSILKFQRFKNLYWVFKSLMNRSWDFKDLLIVQFTIAARGFYWHWKHVWWVPDKAVFWQQPKEKHKAEFEGSFIFK